MPTSADLLKLAMQHHHDGNCAQAELLYRQALEADPAQPDAHHFLGLLAQQTGRHDMAIKLIRQAVALNPTVAAYHFNLGVILKAQGQTAEAIDCYRLALRQNPQFLEANVNLAGELQAQGELEQAAALYRQALGVQSHHAGLHNNLGVVLKDMGQWTEAIDCYRQALRLDPEYADALDNLAIALREQGEFAQAADLCRQALRINPSHCHAHNSLGLILHDLDRPAEAIASYRQALSIKPRHAGALNNLAAALIKLGQHDEAIECLRQALSIQPNYALAHINLGNAFKDQHKFAEAMQSYRQALRINPRLSEAYYNLGIVLMEDGSPHQAALAYRLALGINPKHADAHYNLANTLSSQGMFDEAMACYRVALQIKPNHVLALINLGNILKDQGRLDEAIACYQKASTLEPEQLAWHCNLLYTLLYHPDYDAHALLTELRRWADGHAGQVFRTTSSFSNDPSPQRRLRIGYVSADFRDHPLGRNIWPLLSQHNHGEFEVTIYAALVKADVLTEQFRRCADHWCAVGGWSDQQVAERVRQDGIDILVDLNLHMAGSRLLVFARKPAPVQVTFAGYPGSTGLRTIDYRLTDPYLDPPGQFDDCYSEVSIRLPHTFWCFDPCPGGPEGSRDALDPQVSVLPALNNGLVTFGCLNNFCKINKDVLVLWARVLSEVAGSRLILLAQPGSHRQRTIDFLAEHRIAGERIEFCTPRPRSEYLALYNRLDIGLDTLPCNGHTTSLDSYWMGVPVVTLVGSTVAGRAGLSQLTNLGLKELATETPGQFVRAAAALASDLSRLKEIRAGLRQRMRQSALMDAAGFARGIEDAYRTMWQTWCQQQR